MATIVDCPSCDRKLRVPDELLGEKVKCPTCGGTFDAVLPGSAAPAPPPPAPPAPAPEKGASPVEPPVEDRETPPAPAEEAPPPEPPPRAPAKRPWRPPVSDEDLRPCPYCGERIHKNAARCRYCDEHLDDEKDEDEE